MPRTTSASICASRYVRLLASPCSIADACLGRLSSGRLWSPSWLITRRVIIPGERPLQTCYRLFWIIWPRFLVRHQPILLPTLDNGSWRFFSAPEEFVSLLPASGSLLFFFPVLDCLSSYDVTLMLYTYTVHSKECAKQRAVVKQPENACYGGAGFRCNLACFVFVCSTKRIRLWLRSSFSWAQVVG